MNSANILVTDFWMEHDNNEFIIPYTSIKFGYKEQKGKTRTYEVSQLGDDKEAFITFVFALRDAKKRRYLVWAREPFNELRHRLDVKAIEPPAAEPAKNESAIHYIDSILNENDTDNLPDWIKTGSAAMLGTTHTTKPFSSIKALANALAPFKNVGDWKMFKETGYSKTGTPRTQYIGIIPEKK